MGTYERACFLAGTSRPFTRFRLDRGVSFSPLLNLGRVGDAADTSRHHASITSAATAVTTDSASTHIDAAKSKNVLVTRKRLNWHPTQGHR